MSWFFGIKTLALLTGISVLVSTALASEPLKSPGMITPQQIGEFITVSGTAEQFRAPSSRREPYSFRLRDQSGQSIRVFAWPETMTAIKGWQDLTTTGTKVSMTAEVIDHEGEFELQIQDWAEVKVESAWRTASGLSTATVTSSKETTGAR